MGLTLPWLKGSRLSSASWCAAAMGLQMPACTRAPAGGPGGRGTQAYRSGGMPNAACSLGGAIRWQRTRAAATANAAAANMHPSPRTRCSGHGAERAGAPVHAARVALHAPAEREACAAARVGARVVLQSWQRAHDRPVRVNRIVRGCCHPPRGLRCSRAPRAGPRHHPRRLLRRPAGRRRTRPSWRPGTRPPWQPRAALRPHARR